jgi:acyl-CoA synthetase (AMP-forming)/AMP-acid ligase II
VNLSSVVVKATKSLDDKLIPNNLPIGKFVVSSYEKNSQWKNDLLLVDGTTKKSLTYAQGYDLIYRTASALRKLGAKNGFGVAIISPNHINFPSVFLGTSLVGGYSVTLNPLAPDQELIYQLELAEAKIIFTHPLLLPKIVPIAEKLKLRIVSFDDVSAPNVMSFQDFVKNESLSNIDIESFPENGKDFDVNSTAVIPFSSGTTGLSKGVMLSHRNLISNIIQGKVFESRYFDRNQGDIINLIPLPFFHIFGMMAGMCIPMYAGGTTISMSSFDLQRFLELIQEYKVKRAFVVPPIIIALVKHPIVANYDLSSIECLFSGAAPLGGEIREACQKRLKCKVLQGWGLTETR